MSAGPVLLLWYSRRLTAWGLAESIHQIDLQAFRILFGETLKKNIHLSAAFNKGVFVHEVFTNCPHGY